MAKGGPDWDGLLKWSIANSDGSRPRRNLSEEDRRWFMEAMQSQSVDVITRMKEITLVMQTPEHVLETQGVTAENIEDMLDELQEHVESIDMANDLHSIGGLVPLLDYLEKSNAGIRAKAAEVVTTIVQNNPRGQQLVMEAKGFESLLSNFTSDPDITARTKSLGAISSLIRHNKPGIMAFRLGNGYAGLRDALSSGNVKFQRKALNLIQYLLSENSSDCKTLTELGFPRMMIHLAAANDADIREASLRGLLELARDKPDGSSGCFKEDGNFRQLLEERIRGIVEMSPEDLGAAIEERQLVDSLWKACYEEPSALQERGLLSLPGEDEPPPDVTSRHFEPPLRSWAAANPGGERKGEVEKKSIPLLLGSAPVQGGSGAANGSSFS